MKKESEILREKTKYETNQKCAIKVKSMHQNTVKIWNKEYFKFFFDQKHFIFLKIK